VLQTAFIGSPVRELAVLPHPSAGGRPCIRSTRWRRGRWTRGTVRTV